MDINQRAQSLAKDIHSFYGFQDHSDYVLNKLNQFFEEAVLEERDECAKIAETKKFDRLYDCGNGEFNIGCGECRVTHNGCKEISDAIRKKEKL